MIESRRTGRPFRAAFRTFRVSVSQDSEPREMMALLALISAALDAWIMCSSARFRATSTVTDASVDISSTTSAGIPAAFAISRTCRCRSRSAWIASLLTCSTSICSIGILTPAVVASVFSMFSTPVTCRDLNPAVTSAGAYTTDTSNGSQSVTVRISWPFSSRLDM